MGNRIVIGLALCLVSLWSARDAAACSCALPAVQGSFWTADVVFVGVARSVTGTNTQEARLAVEEWLRGDRIGSELVIVSRGVGGSCDYGFQAGTRYVVYATRGPRDEWRAGLCSSTSPIERAAKDLEYIRDALAHPGPGDLLGNVFIDGDPTERVASGGPIAGMRLVLRGGGRTLRTSTDANGNYRFEAVPAGEYTLVADVPPHLAPVAPKRIVVGKGARIGHTFWTTRR